MKKNILSLGIFLVILISSVSSPLFAGGESKYTTEIDACIEAKNKKPDEAKKIEKYVCPVGLVNSQRIAFQVIMSLEFQKLDDEIKTVLKAIYAGSNKDIGQLAANIEDNFNKKYPAKYKEICDKTVKDEANLYFQEKGNPPTTDNNIQGFLHGQSSDGMKLLSCQELANRKLIAYKESAWLLGESAVVNSFKKDKHEYMRKLKDQYEKFLNKWTTYIGQLSTIKDKWPSKTKNTQ